MRRRDARSREGLSFVVAMGSDRSWLGGSGRPGSGRFELTNIRKAWHGVEGPGRAVRTARRR